MACGSYLPISLVNVNFKILTKILVIRLAPVLPFIVDIEKVCFISQWEPLDLLHTATLSKTPTLFILSMDAEKLFDRVDWDFLFDSLHDIELGHT